MTEPENNKEGLAEEKEQDTIKRSTLKIIIIINWIVLILAGIILFVFHFWLGSWLFWIYDETENLHTPFERYCFKTSSKLLENLPLWLIGCGLAQEIDNYDAGKILWEREYDAVPYVFDVIDHKNKDVREEAIEFLEEYIRDKKINYTEVIHMLPSCLKSRNILKRRSAAILSCEIPKEFITPFIPLWEKLLHDESLTIRALASIALTENKIVKDISISTAKELLTSTKIEYNDMGYEIVNNLKNHAEPLIPVLIQIAVKSKYILYESEEAFFNIGPAAIPHLLRELSNPPYTRRPVLLALLAIYKEKADSAVPKVESLLKDKDIEIRLCAAKTYLRITEKNHEKAYTVFFEAAAHENPFYRAAAAEALHTRLSGNAEYPQLLQILEKLLCDKDVCVRSNAVYSIGSYGRLAAGAAPVLVKMYEDQPEDDYEYRFKNGKVRFIIIKTNIINALGRIENNSPEVMSFLDQVIRKEIAHKTAPKKPGHKTEAFDNDKLETALMAIKAIGITKNHVPLLIQLLNDEYDDISREAIRGLRSLGTDAEPAISRLMKILTDSNDRKTQLEAAVALSDISKGSKKFIKKIKEAIKTGILDDDDGYYALATTFNPDLIPYFKNEIKKNKKSVRREGLENYYNRVAEDMIKVLEAVKRNDTKALIDFLRDYKRAGVCKTLLSLRAIGTIGNSNHIEFLKKLKEDYYYIPEVDDAIKTIKSREKE